RRLLTGGALPYPGGAAALVEFGHDAFPFSVQARFFDLHRRGIVPILAHPERYQPVWKDDECLTPLLDAGAHLLLDLCSLVGKYGRQAQRSAEILLAQDAYEAACSDAHKPRDVDDVVRAMDRLLELVGKDEFHRLLAESPRMI